MIIYRFDGSFEGLLTCVFEAFEMKQFQVQVVMEDYFQPNVFDESIYIHTEVNKAKRVLIGVEKITSKNFCNELQTAYLSELPQVYQWIFNCLIEIFKTKTDQSTNYGNPLIINIAKSVKSVSRERHRMKAFIRFKKTNNSLFYAVIAPDYNVLPLVLKHFKNRYADQHWVIYDEKRKYGFYFDTQQLYPVTFLDLVAKQSTSLQNFKNDEREDLFDELWKDYFESINIKERKNTKLHLQHVPKRYWKYLNEKHPHKKNN